MATDSIQGAEVVTVPGRPLTVSPREAAQIVGISKGAMFAAIAAKRIPFFRVGRTYRIPYEGLIRWHNEMAEQHAELPGG